MNNIKKFNKICLLNRIIGVFGFFLVYFTCVVIATIINFNEYNQPHKITLLAAMILIIFLGYCFIEIIDKDLLKQELKIKRQLKK